MTEIIDELDLLGDPREDLIDGVEAENNWLKAVREANHDRLLPGTPILAHMRRKKTELIDVKIPEAPAGTYLVYARDKDGNFSTGRKAGRKKPHQHPRQNGYQSLWREYFKRDFEELLMVEVKDSIAEGRTPVEELNQQQVMPILFGAMQEAQKYLVAKGRSSRQFIKRRERSARKLNTARLAGAQNQIAFTNPTMTWADVRKVTQRKYNVAPKPKAPPVEPVSPEVVASGDQPTA